MTRHFRVYTDYNNYIAVDETELEKALRAFKNSSGAIFNNGATSRIAHILPDDVKMMGWNDSYRPTPEEQGEISRDRTCKSARVLTAQIKEHLALNPNQPFKELENPVKKHTDGLTSLGELLK